MGKSVRTPFFVSTGLFSREASSLKKKLFQMCFFWANLFKHGSPNCIFLGFLIFRPIFFWTPRKFLLTGLSELHSTCPKNFFRFLKNIQSAFHNFQKFSSTVVRTALMFLGFLIGLYVNFGQAILCVHRIVFMGSIFFEKNTFPNVFHILGW